MRNRISSSFLLLEKVPELDVHIGLVEYMKKGIPLFMYYAENLNSYHLSFTQDNGKSLGLLEFS